MSNESMKQLLHKISGIIILIAVVGNLTCYLFDKLIEAEKAAIAEDWNKSSLVK